MYVVLSFCPELWCGFGEASWRWFAHETYWCGWRACFCYCWPLTSDPNPSLTRGQGYLNPNPLVNEVDHLGAIAGNVQLKKSLSKNRWCGDDVAPPTKQMSCVIALEYGTDIIVCVLMLSRLSCDSGHVCGLSVGSQRSVKFLLRMSILEKRDDVDLGVSFQPLKCIKSTLPASAAAPL